MLVLLWTPVAMFRLSGAPMIRDDLHLVTRIQSAGEVKIRMEEHLMLATFPDEYPRYRRQVPQLVPGLYVLRQRHSASS